MNKNIAIAIILLATAGVMGGMFFAGTKYGQAQTSQARRQFVNDFSGMPAGQNSRSQNKAGGMAIGEINAIDDQSFTVKTQNGGSKLVFFSDGAKISKWIDAAKSDLAAGVRVTVSGTANSEGAIIAKTIQIGALMPGAEGAPQNDNFDRKNQ